MRWILIITLFTWMGVHAQPMEFASNQVTESEDTEEKEHVDSAASDTLLEVVKMVNANLFDTALIPCAHIYDYSWDSLNLDLPRVTKKDTCLDILLGLVENECDYVHPCPGPITSDFGWRRYRMHKGVVIDLVTGDSVVAAFDGVVRIAKYNYGGFGHYVVIRHYNGLETLYGHLSKRMVVPNQTVKAGEVIGLGGSTGRSTGSHLHFETLYRGTQINPNSIISFKDHSLKHDSIHLTLADFKYTVRSSSSASYAPGGKVYYRVRRGDSLWRIAKRYGTSVDRICRLNGISRNSTLRIGKTLRVR